MMLPQSISQACSTTGARTFSRQRPSLCGAPATAAAFPPSPLQEAGGRELAASVRTHTEAMYRFRMLSRAEAAVQVAYVDTWVQLATVCCELLEQAAACCHRLAAEGVEDAFTATPRGRDYLSGVGQVYGGLALLIVAAQVYSPWLRTAGVAGEEVWKLCSKGQQAWESSGVEGMVKGVLSSPAVADLDSVGESGEAAGRQVCETVCGERRAPLLCGICLLPVLPFQYPTVEWGGRYYLLPLANLWANRVAADPQVCRRCSCDVEEDCGSHVSKVICHPALLVK